MEKEWYVVNTYSGHEYKVKEKLESKIESMGLQDNIFRIVIPETTEVEVKNGVKKEKQKGFGYRQTRPCGWKYLHQTARWN